MSGRGRGGEPLPTAVHGDRAPLPLHARWAPSAARGIMFLIRENVLNENFERSTRISTRRGRSQARRQRVDSIQTFEERFSSPPLSAMRDREGGGRMCTCHVLQTTL